MVRIDLALACAMQTFHGYNVKVIKTIRKKIWKLIEINQNLHIDTTIDKNHAKLIDFDYVDWFDKESNVSNIALNKTLPSVLSRNDFSLKLNDTIYNATLLDKQEVLTSSIPNLTVINSTLLNETLIETVSSNQTKQGIVRAKVKKV